MPELPEVETERRYLASHVLHQAVDAVRVPHADILSDTSPSALGRSLKGRAIEWTRRHGKYLFAGFGGDVWLVMHFGMTGTLQYYRHENPAPEYTALLILFEGGHDLAYVSRRRLGRLSLIIDPDKFVAAKRLGPDALDIGLDDFRSRLSGARGNIKAWLMNQSHLAGIGNEYSDEILFQARLHPSRSAGGLSDQETRALHRAMNAVLRKAVDIGADPARMPASWLYPRRAAKARCPRCKGAIATTRSGGRTAYYCPRCQARP